MQRSTGRPGPSTPLATVPATGGETVPTLSRSHRPPPLLSAAARKATRQRMLLLRQASLDRVVALTGIAHEELRRYRAELSESGIAELLLQRGAGLAFARELPQGALLYLLVRALRPRRIVETGVRPGYSTAWLLAGLDANAEGELVSLGPGPTAGRSVGVHEVTVGQFVAPSLRGRWTLVLGNTEDHLRSILAPGGADLFFYDNGPDLARAQFELRAGWSSLSRRGILLAHHVDANSAWIEFCRGQGLAPQLLDPGPPPMGALAVGRR